jgi:hypothetical protein
VRIDAADERKLGWWRRASSWLILLVLGSAIAWTVQRGLTSSTSHHSTTPPVRFYLQTDPAKEFRGAPNWQGYSLVLPQSRTAPRSKPPALCRAWYAWGKRRGGVDADLTEAYLTLQGRPNTAILIQDARVEILSRTQPRSGVEAVCVPPGGAVASPRLVDINLDARPPLTLLAEAGDDRPGRQHLQLALRGTETEQLIIRAHTRRCDCQWRLHLDVVADGKPLDVMVDDHGKPFRTVAAGSSKHLTWVSNRWQPMSDAAWSQTRPMVWQQSAR